MSVDDPRALVRRTVEHYERSAADFWAGTKHHDVSQNMDALLDAIEGAAPFDVLDLGCGPGRDLMEFRARGHRPVGLDACESFAAMARSHADVPVLCQSFLDLDLPTGAFDGVFANASLFHVPTVELPRVLGDLWRTLRPRGVLFSSNPRGDNQEGWSGDRWGAYYDHATWVRALDAAGFDELSHYYRPPGRPRAEQPWLAVVARRRG